MTVLAAVIFDVDGTLVDSEQDGHWVASNSAFQDVGMPDRWTEEEYGTLLRVAGGRERLLHYLALRGRTGEDAGRLVTELHRRKTAWMRRLVDEDAVPPRPGAQRLVSELADAGLRLAIATTGQRAWVEPLIDRHFGLDTFEQVVTGSEVTRLKPDPAAYRLVLRRLGLEPGACLAVEDSGNGVRAAVGAGIPCLAVTNVYTSKDDLSGAVLVTDGFGPGAHVLREGPVAMPTGTVTAPLLSLLRGALGTRLPDVMPPRKPLQRPTPSRDPPSSGVG
ncbi:MAG: HAD-IA family hydrolase [Lapillicoccus sp.]